MFPIEATYNSIMEPIMDIFEEPTYIFIKFMDLSDEECVDMLLKRIENRAREGENISRNYLENLYILYKDFAEDTEKKLIYSI